MSNFKWRDSHIARFLELYQAEECLWNIRSDNYKNITMREKSYEKIRLGMKIEILTLADIKNKIKSIRTNYIQRGTEQNSESHQKWRRSRGFI